MLSISAGVSVPLTVKISPAATPASYRIGDDHATRVEADRRGGVVPPNVRYPSMVNHELSAWWSVAMMCRDRLSG